MTEYATTPSAIAEWKEQRTRTADWVEKFSVPGLPPTPSSSSDSDKRSLWDGGGWEPPSDCESSCSVPPTMMLQYPDSRQVVITPTTAPAMHPDGEGHGHSRGDNVRSRSRGASANMSKRSGSGHRTNRAYVQGEHLVSPSAIGVGAEERTEHVGSSLRSAEHRSARTRTHTHTRTHAPTNPAAGITSPVAKSIQNTNGTGAGAVVSQTSSMRLARAAAAPLPDSRSSSSGLSAPRSAGAPPSGNAVRSIAASKMSASGAGPFDAGAVPDESHRATSAHTHAIGSMHQPSIQPNAGSLAPSHQPSVHVSAAAPAQTHTHTLSNRPSHVPSQHASNAPFTSYPPTHQPSHVASRTPTQQPSQHPSHVPSNSPTERPSVHPSHVPSQHPSHVTSNNPSQHPSHAPTHQPSHVPSHHPSQVPSQHPSQTPSHHSTVHPQPSHPPSAFSNHTVHPSAPPLAGGANGAPISPPSVNSINSRAISVSDSRSSGPPEPIVIHPPSSVHSSAAGGAGPVPVANAPSSASASLSYVSVPPRGSRVYDPQQKQQHEQQLLLPLQEERRSTTPSHRSSRSHSHSVTQQQQDGHAHAGYNGQLPTPISPTPQTSMPMRTPSTMSTTGLGGGYVLVDVPSSGHEEMEREIADKKGSGKSQRRDRGSLFNVFGVGRHGGGGGHTRSKSLPMNGMDAPLEEKEQPVPPSHAHHNSQSHNSQMPNPNYNPYLTPISPLSPTSPVADPLSGPHPPPIVYAPARHHRATHYSPPRIWYSPRGASRQAPYDTQHMLYAQTQQGHGQAGYPSPTAYAHAYPHPHHQYAPNGSPTSYLHPAVIVPAHGYAPVVEHSARASPGSVRRSRTLQEPVRDSGWDEGMRESPASAVRAAADHHGVKPGDVIPRDFAHEQHPSVNGQATPTGHPPPELRSPQVASSSPVKAAEEVTPASPTMSQMAAGVGAGNASDSGSVQTNLAGVGTVSARSRSRGRSAHNDLGHISEGEGEGAAEAEEERGRSRSRSRSRVRGPPGMVYSASAPQPRGSIAPPHAAMMIPPPSSVRERGVRDTPYPTPPGSVSEQLYHQRHSQQAAGYMNGVLATPSAFSSIPLHGSGHPHTYQPGHPAQPPTLAPVSPVNESSPSPGGLISRFRDIYHASHGAPGNVPPHVTAEDRHSPSSSLNRTRGRGRTRGRLRRDIHDDEKLHANGDGNVRSKSVDSQASRSSASTYYVLPTPGQKVRIIRTDGMPTTTTTSISQNNSAAGGGWLRKASRFLHRDREREQQQQQQPSPVSPHPSRSHHSQAPAIDDSRPPSGQSNDADSAKSRRSGKKGGRKLVRRNSTGSAALLSSASVSRQAGAGAHVDVDASHGRENDVPVDIVYPGR
ncbi:hypothetical protein A7U60_g4048 [Sanghuangporus baumii]|uniref:Uncharacterized protein n=1 Tax=Sanghuangporus baumii TaxID=108892 RepID=A0A9Q5HZG2_SANBA|nr:hypothetical protein A7U60_g4048 [Sanghuangporus baumii]